MASSIIKTVISSNASKKAASLQDNAAQRAADLTLDQYRQNRQDSMPWLNQGTAAINQLGLQLGLSGDASNPAYGALNKQFTMADFQQDPGFQFRLDEGEKAINRSAAARNGVLSGAATKSLGEFNQNLASQEYTNAYNRFQNNQDTLYNRLAGIAGSGQTTANQLANQGLTAVGQANDYRTSGAAARAAGVIGSANAWNAGITGLENKAARIFMGGF